MISAAAFHGGASFRYRLVVDADASNDSNSGPVRFQMLDVLLLMTQPPLPQDLQLRVPCVGLRQGAECDRKVQLGQMSAIQMPYQIRGAKKQSVADLLHQRNLHPAADAFKLTKDLIRRFAPARRRMSKAFAAAGNSPQKAQETGTGADQTLRATWPRSFPPHKLAESVRPRRAGSNVPLPR